MAKPLPDSQTPSPALPQNTEREGQSLARGASLAIAVVSFTAIVVAATGDFCVEVFVQGTIDGTILAGWLLAAFGYGRLMLRGLRETPGSLRVVTEIALGLGLLGLIEGGLGFAGLLSGATAWATIGGGIIAALYALRDCSFTDVKAWLSGGSTTANIAWLWAVPIAIAFVAASMAPGFLWKPLDPHPYDVMSYHLQIPREWYDAGRIVPLRHNSFSYFPTGMETHFLTAMHLRGGPWAGMYLCQFVSLAHGVLTALAVAAVCRSMHVGKVGSTLAGIATLAVPWTLMLSSVCYVESGVMLYTLLAVAWATRAAWRGDFSRHVESPSETKTPTQAPSVDHFPVRAMTLAGAFAGFACGMKYTAVAMTAVPLLALWPVVAWRAVDRQRLVLSWLAAAIACGVVFSPWLIRNAIITGNPVFPLATGVLGPGHFTPEQIDRYQIAHSPPPAERPLPARLSAAWRGVAADPQFAFVLVPAALGAAALVIVRRHRAGVFFVLILVAMCGIWLFATHLLPRFLTPAIPVAVVLIAVSLTPLPRAGRWIGGAVCVVQIGIGVTWTGMTLSTVLPLARSGLFRLTDMTPLETDGMKAARQSGGKIALIGDAQAFFVSVPSDRLAYRGVFDVVVPPGTSLVDGWLGQSVDDLRHGGYWVVINPGELERLSRTYAHLPKPDASLGQVGHTPVVLPPLR